MSRSQFPGYGTGKVEEFDEQAFLEELRETYSSYEKSAQALDAEGIPLSERNQNQLSRHYDGQGMVQHFSTDEWSMRPFWKVIQRAERQSQLERDDRTFTEFPSAFLHLVLHLTDWERREIASGDPTEEYLEQMPRERRKVLQWFAEDPENRMMRKRPGGTEVLVHGEQGSTKTTCLLYLAALMMQINNEDICWIASQDAIEWIAMAPYTTVCLPAGVEVSVKADPSHPAYEGDGVPITFDDFTRDQIRYRDPRDLMRKISNRTPGQFYAVYPDPHFRRCESITGWRYHPLEDVEETNEMTDIWHWVFALFEQRLHGDQHHRFMTIMSDEVHKWMHRKASKDRHDWWSKISDWGSSYADGRKFKLSAAFGTHEYGEVHPMAEDKIRWGCTMNGEPFPNSAPISGDTKDQFLGQGTFWNKMEWAPLEWPDMKAVYSSDAEIIVSYPEWERMKDAKEAKGGE